MTDPTPEQVAAARAAEGALYAEAVRAHFEQRTLALRVERDALAERVTALEQQIDTLTTETEESS